MSPEWQRSAINTSVIHSLTSLLSSMQSKTKKRRSCLQSANSILILLDIASSFPKHWKAGWKLPSHKQSRGVTGCTHYLISAQLLSAAFETGPDQGNSTSLQYTWSLRWSFISLKYIYHAHSNSFLKLLFCILAIHFRKAGPDWKLVCCSDTLRKLKGTKNYTNRHLDRETNWWFQSASWQAIEHFSYFILFSYYCAHHKKYRSQRRGAGFPHRGPSAQGYQGLTELWTAIIFLLPTDRPHSVGGIRLHTEQFVLCLTQKSAEYELPGLPFPHKWHH